ncbi:MAG: cytidylate kinase-like family protein [Tyzzerella sp.]|nr:cytidylate kinase-like family protein [Tyzzerella sp.]
MSENKTIITIGRQYGSGGHDIGEALAKELGVKLYDKEMLKRAAKESGLCEELFETHDEKPTNSFLYSLVMDTYSLGYSSGTYADMPINHKVFLAQFDAIKKIAEEGSCVMVGRCADYALEEYDNVINIFIYADLDKRIRRIARMYDMTDAKAKDVITKADKKRASYYNYYTNKEWGDATSYDLCLNSAKLGIEGSVKAILDYIKLRQGIDNPKL